MVYCALHSQTLHLAVFCSMLFVHSTSVNRRKNGMSMSNRNSTTVNSKTNKSKEVPKVLLTRFNSVRN